MAVIRIDSVLADIAQREAGPSGIRLVGIDGPSGSGKSTLAVRLSACSLAPLIEIDDFVSWRDFSGWWLAQRLEDGPVGALGDSGGGHLHPPQGRGSPHLPDLGRSTCRAQAEPRHGASW